MKALKFTLLISAWIVFAGQNLDAQTLVPGAYDYYELGLLFSQYDYGGSARIQSLGGAQTALGADISSALSNPAGLGLYNKSEVSLTPAVYYFGGNSDYLGGRSDFGRTKFNIGNFGLALQKNINSEIGFLSGTFAISFSKINNFNQQYSINGFNRVNDILDYYAQNANQFAKGSWPVHTRQAFDVFLIDEFQDPTTNQFFHDRLIENEKPQYAPVHQFEEITTSGSQNQWSISYGANVKDVFFIGGGVGIQSLRYEIEKYYVEDYASGNILMDMDLLEQLEIRGAGINANIGILARPINSLMIGASIISPTILTLSEISNISTLSNYDNYEYNNETILNEELVSEEYVFDYQITTPARYNTGATFFIGKNGFLTADVEFVDYSKIKFDSQDDPLSDQQLIAQTEFKNTVNYKFGGEARLDNVRIRLGYALQKSPYVNDGGINRDVTKYTAGIGYRNSKFYTDLSTVFQTGVTSYSPYTFAPEQNEALKDINVTPVSDIDYKNLNFSLSVGLFF